MQLHDYSRISGKFVATKMAQIYLLFTEENLAWLYKLNLVKPLTP